jgi:biotin carboxyl carrier protein
VATAAAPAAGPAPVITGPVTTSVKVQEGAQTRTFSVTVEPVGGAETPAPAAEAAPAAAGGTQVFSTFAGAVEVVDILVKEGDKVNEGDVVAAIEAMKAKHDIKAPCGGTVSAIHVSIGDEIDSSKPIVSIA